MFISRHYSYLSKILKKIHFQAQNNEYLRIFLSFWTQEDKLRTFWDVTVIHGGETDVDEVYITWNIFILIQ
jgi:hypothetical protein